jgi:hypothetical protein
VRKLVLLLAVLATAISASSAHAITYGTVDVNNTYSYVRGLVTGAASAAPPAYLPRDRRVGIDEWRESNSAPHDASAESHRTR